MKDEIHSTSINPDVVEQFLALMNTHCKSLLQPDDDMRYPFHGQPDAQWAWDIHATSGD